MIRTVTRLALVALSATTFATSAFAEAVNVQINRTQLVTVSVKPATVVVGNPAIADVTVNGNQVFINGFSSGSTNVLMLDEFGSNVATLDITVSQGSGETVAAMFKSGARHSYNCTEYCDPMPQVGDEGKSFGEANGQYGSGRSAALGAAAPSAGASENKPTDQNAQ